MLYEANRQKMSDGNGREFQGWWMGKKNGREK
jgi:hypothetical protein